MGNEVADNLIHVCSGIMEGMLRSLLLDIIDTMDNETIYYDDSISFDNETHGRFTYFMFEKADQISNRFITQLHFWFSSK